ncbi:MAG TPA: GerMN domain-containing protein [Oscillospiraceae bacterium]|nr:GerMN domain-containing protein [Oscillospiraceae bacterium]HXK77095.1 GerMN domain-containing protein [Oscillospiraceae bacterium]
MKKLSAFLMICLFLTVFTGCWGKGDTTPDTSSSLPESSSEAESGETVGDYFPIENDTRYTYQGAGNEYATYTVYNDYISETQVQQRIDNGGTVVAKVISISDGKLVQTFSRGETYHRQNYLNEAAEEEILLTEPIVVGTSWTLEDGSTRSITSVSAAVSTPSGDYEAVVEVTTEGTNNASRQYYAKGAGLVKVVYPLGDTEVSSTLSAVEKNVPLKQTVRFFYPDAEEQTIVYEDREVEFHTNDETGIVLAAAYKDAPAGTSAVLLGNTMINSLSLGDDGRASVDLSQAFLTEIGAVPENEEIILQSIVNTFGYYFGTDQVILTVERQPYDSGTTALDEDEALKTNFSNAASVSA